MHWGKIFISHSTRTDQGRAFLDAVRVALEKKYDVLLDEKVLEPGDDWREKIYEWIEEAHGAVLLLTAEALNSRFVQIETSIISWRSYRQPDFIFIPVIVGDVKPAQLKKGIYGKLAVDSVHAINLDNPAAVAEKIRKLLGKKLKRALRPRTAEEVLVDRIAGHLKDGGASVQALREVSAGRFAPSLARASGSADACYEQFARELLKADTLDAFSAIEQLVQRGLKREVRDLLNLVAPSWVEREAAKPVAEVPALSDVERRTLALGGRGNWARNSYMGRACARSLKHGLDLCELVVPAVEKRDDVLADFERQIIDHFTIKGEYEEEEDEEDVLRQIEKRTEEAPVFVVLSPDLLPYADLAAKLGEKFKTLTFFALTGGAEGARLSPLHGRFELLKPVDRERENATRLEYDRVARFISNSGVA